MDVEKVFVSHPIGEMPPDVASAVFGRTLSPALSADIPAFIPAPNPWLAKPGVDGVLKYENPEAEEREFASSLEPIRKLFTPPAPVRRPLKLGELPALPPEPDDDEREYFQSISEIHRLFHPTASSAASESPSKLDKSTDGWDEEIPAPATQTEPIAKRMVEDDTKDSADWSPELQELITQIVSGLDEWGDDETEAEYDLRIARELNAALVAQGRKPLLSYS